MKLCKSCNGPVCPYCGGCINEGECSCETPEVTTLKARIEELEQALATEQQARFAAKQDHQHWRERCQDLLDLCLDCWTQFAYEAVDGYASCGLSALERLRAELEEAGLIDEKGRAVER